MTLVAPIPSVPGDGARRAPGTTPVADAATNVVVHGYRGGPGWLEVTAALRGDRRTRIDGFDAVLARLDETAYAPGGASAAVPPDLRTSAVAVADAIVEEAAR